MANNEEKGDHLKMKFISGVVEGFYGRPWNQEQRKDLFERSKELGFNTYVYAPKDDVLHRKLWRQLYDDAEKENLKHLIYDAESKGISFVYAISPGLDIIFSCPKDVQFLRNKLKQVADLGCKSFALLFDDIEPELSLPDKQDFESFADAQVTITNSIYDFLGKPHLFLFCPTEYCTTRAKPSVEKSEYLRALGKNLHKNIDILWTGPKVVSKDIPIGSVEAVSKVLKRKPVIWDNSHANDYDQRRIFLGPYNGRPTDLYLHLNGILSNPNCEYEGNFIALHTISHWVSWCAYKQEKSSTKEITEEERNNCKDIKSLVNEVEMEVGDAQTDPDKLKAIGAVKDVMKDSTKTEAGETESDMADESAENAKETLEKVDYDAVSALENAVSDWLTEFKKEKVLSKPNLDLTTSPSKLAVLDSANSLHEAVDENDGDSVEKPEVDVKNEEEKSGDGKCCPYHMSGKRMKMNKKKENDANVTKEDLMLMVDLFFLPYEHGSKAKHLVSEFKWIQANAPPIETNKQNEKLVKEWEERAANYRKLCQEIADMFRRVTHAPNKPLVQQLYPYIWDIKEVSMLLEAFVKWLGSKTRKCKAGSNQIPEDPEPWMFKGGLAEELERLLPVDMATELSPAATIPAHSSNVYTIRPYFETDKTNLFNVCLHTYQDELNEHDLFPNYPELPGDWFLGAYLRDSEEAKLFILEDDDGVCGYCAGAFDSKAFNAKSGQWFEEISNKYDSPPSALAPYEKVFVEKICKPSYFLPDEIYQNFPAQIVINLLPRAQVSRIGKRLSGCIMSMMKSREIRGVHCQVSLHSHFMNGLLRDIGFHSVALLGTPPDGLSIMGMNL